MNRTRLAWISCVAVLATASLLAACGGSGGSPSPKATPTSDQTPTATASPKATGTAGPKDTPTAIPTPTGTDLEDLAAMFVDGVDGKVVYEYSSNFGGKPNGTYTVYRRGDDYRQDWHSTLDGIEFTAVTIITKDTAYTCTLTATDRQCTKVSREDAELQLNLFEPIYEVPEKIGPGLAGLKATELPSRKIAGVEAFCFDVTMDGRLAPGPEGREELELCFSEKGQFLSMERRVIFDIPGRIEGDLHLEAQSVTEAKGDDFKPPSAVTG